MGNIINFLQNLDTLVNYLFLFLGYFLIFAGLMDIWTSILDLIDIFKRELKNNYTDRERYNDRKRDREYFKNSLDFILYTVSTLTLFKILIKVLIFILHSLF